MLPVHPHPLWQVLACCYSLPSFADVRTSFFGIPTQPKTRSSPGVLGAFSTGVGLLRPPASPTETFLDSQPLQSETAVAGLPHVSLANKSYIHAYHQFCYSRERTLTYTISKTLFRMQTMILPSTSPSSIWLQAILHHKLWYMLSPLLRTPPTPSTWKRHIPPQIPLARLCL